MPISVDFAPTLSYRNRGEVDDSVRCGCYFCLRTFDHSEIEEWADEGETALCPHCGVDAVIPDETDAIRLGQALERWFTGQSQQV